MSKIRIVSDGVAWRDTFIYVDGKDISHTVKEVSWSIKAGKPADVTITFVPNMVSVDLSGDVDG